MGTVFSRFVSWLPFQTYTKHQLDDAQAVDALHYFGAFQLDDLDDDCLSEVLDRLPKKELYRMLRVNKRMKRLAKDRIRAKDNRIKLIEFIQENSLQHFKCTHLGRIRPDQFLSLNPWTLSQDARYISLLNKYSGVKSLDFGTDDYQMPNELLAEAAELWPQLECVKFCKTFMYDDEWDRFLDRFGHRMVHILKRRHNFEASDTQQLETIAAKCPNIKQIDWVTACSLNSDLLGAFKLFPKSCKIGLSCPSLEDVFEDIFHQLNVKELNWPSLCNRVERLTNLKFRWIKSDQMVRGVDFVNLKRLVFTSRGRYCNESVVCLASSRFPRLEEFCFSAGFTEDHYSALFRSMPLVKKLTIDWHLPVGKDPQLPKSAIHLLDKLDTIDLTLYVQRMKTWTWKPESFLNQLERYVDEITSLKSLTVDVKCWLADSVKDRLEKLNQNQKCVVLNITK